MTNHPRPLRCGSHSRRRHSPQILMFASLAPLPPDGRATLRSALDVHRARRGQYPCLLSRAPRAAAYQRLPRPPRKSNSLCAITAALGFPIRTDSRSNVRRCIERSAIARSTQHAAIAWWRGCDEPTCWFIGPRGQGRPAVGRLGPLAAGAPSSPLVSGRSLRAAS